MKIILQHREFVKKKLFRAKLKAAEDSRYFKYALVPDLPFVETDQKFSSSKYGHLDTISTFKIENKKFQNLVFNLNFQSIQDDLIYEQTIEKKRKVYDEFLKHFRNLIRKASADDNYTVHGILKGNSYQETTTVDFDASPSLKVGFHFDTWDKLPIDEMHKCTNRVCVNIGSGPRYLLFFEKSVFEMKKELLSLNNQYSNLFDSNQIGEIYFQEFGIEDKYVHALKLASFEGYCAPTETIWHDGSNYDSEHVDYQITARGKFDPQIII